MEPIFTFKYYYINQKRGCLAPLKKVLDKTLLTREGTELLKREKIIIRGSSPLFQ